MNGVVIQEQAFAIARLELQVLDVSIAVDLEAAARLDAGQHAHRTTGNPVFSRDPPSDLLFADRRRGQIAHRSTGRHDLGQRCCLESLTHLLDVCAEVLQLNLVGPQMGWAVSGDLLIRILSDYMRTRSIRLAERKLANRVRPKEYAGEAGGMSTGTRRDDRRTSTGLPSRSRALAGGVGRPDWAESAGYLRPGARCPGGTSPVNRAPSGKCFRARWRR